LTNTAVSSARLYWDHSLTAKKGFFDVKGVAIPVAVSAYPSEIYTAPRSWAEKAYPKLIHYNKLPKGTHFAAWTAILFRGSSRGFQTTAQTNLKTSARACAPTPRMKRNCNLYGRIRCARGC
jgi:hypothetical protein